jgi:hypothetical protein
MEVLNMASMGIEGLTKRVAINKANTQVIIIAGVASFITVFCLMASKAIVSNNEYRAHVISATSKAKNQLQDNITAYNSLENSYNNFVSQSTNVIGGQATGTAQNSGNNAKIILDALPAAYDFPGLTSTLQKLLTNDNYTITSIGGSDEQLTEGANNYSADPAAVPMPFTFSITNANYQSVTQLMKILQESIRPIQVDNITINGDDSNLTVNVSAHTYYQPSKNVSITKQAVQ